MFKRILMSLVLLGVLAIITGCEKDEVRVHEQKQVGPTIIQQDTIVE